jgi:hypothetical protein
MITGDSNHEVFVITRVAYALAVWHVTETRTPFQPDRNTTKAADGTNMYQWRPGFFLTPSEVWQWIDAYRAMSATIGNTTAVINFAACPRS